MKRSLIAVILALSIAESCQLGAQSLRFSERGYPSVTDPYQSGFKVYYKTWLDLNQAQRRVAPNPGDWYRFDVARGQMDLLERTWGDGSYNRSQMNNAINDLQQVLTFNNVSAQDRKVLTDDLERLRDLRLNYTD